MVQSTSKALHSLYEADETAWLDATAGLLRDGRIDEIDSETLAEYLEDMAKRDRREVESRLVVLLTHILKWEYQPSRRSKSWRLSIVVQRQELADDIGGGVLRTHAQSALPNAYRKAIERAAIETKLPVESFPAECQYSLDELLEYNTDDISE